MSEIFNSKSGASAGGCAPVNLTCPSCKQIGTFARVADNVHDANITSQKPKGPPYVSVVIDIGIRTCPNTDCKAVVFVAKETGSSTPLDTYPKTRIEFDITNVPENLVATFQEALICTSEECYVAAAIMIRRTLEELCADKGATGNNLEKRLEGLGNKIILPQELLEAAHDLRLLGNDAAHIEAKTYDEIGKDEILVAIDLIKELIKASYQYQDLVERLKSRQRIS